MWDTLLSLYSTMYVLALKCKWVLAKKLTNQVKKDSVMLGSHSRSKAMIPVASHAHVGIRIPYLVLLEDSRIGDFRFVYKNDFSILVSRLHIITTQTHLIPQASLST